MKRIFMEVLLGLSAMIALIAGAWTGLHEHDWAQGTYMLVVALLCLQWIRPGRPPGGQEGGL